MDKVELWGGEEKRKKKGKKFGLVHKRSKGENFGAILSYLLSEAAVKKNYVRDTS